MYVQGEMGFPPLSKASTSLLVKGNYHAPLAILQGLPERLSTFGAASTEHSENEIIMQFGLFETKSDLGCSIPALKNMRTSRMPKVRSMCH